jgi:hypothetical protein
MGCPEQLSGLSVVTWNPKESISLKEVAKVNPSFEGMNEFTMDTYYKSIEDTLGLSISDFYRKYIQPGEHACIKVSRDLWPYGYMETDTPVP